MDIKNQGASEKLRDNTDKSLGEERSKTDEYLDQQNSAVTRNAEDTIKADRLTADRKKDVTRAEADDEGSKAVDKNLLLEREQSDKAQILARHKEDLVRQKERFQKRLIAEALLESERQTTDSNLLDERAGIDSDSELHSSQLYEEKSSHKLTKNALVSRDQFLAIVSHDLKNPIGAISMSADLIREEVSAEKIDVQNILKYVDIIERSSDNMDRLIDDLLDVERMANGKLVIHGKNDDICALLEECVELFAPIVGSKSFSMTHENCSESLLADFDHDRILQVLSNLIGNALKFTPRGGAIILRAEKKENEVLISVTDNGPGIPEEKKLKIFDRFSQLGSDDRRGLGLGLFISKWIVEAHDGKIWATSEHGKGSVFSFTLPLRK